MKTLSLHIPWFLVMTIVMAGSFVLNGQIGVNGTPASSSVLDLQSTTKGMLIPRMTITQRNAIAFPATGLFIYQTNNSPGFYHYTGSTWTKTDAFASALLDQDGDTEVHVEKNTDEDKVRFMIGGTEEMVIGLNSDGKTVISLPDAGSNLSLGRDCGIFMSSGTDNTAIGDSAMLNLATGNWNTTVGRWSLRTLWSTNHNTAIGHAALVLSTNGTGNTAFGNSTMLISNTAFQTAAGVNSLLNNTSGGTNTAIGANTLVMDTTGSSNTAIGAYALRENRSGTGNLAFGHRSLYGNMEGSYNTALGQAALEDNTTGDDNSAAGHLALSSNLAGYNNTAVGKGAMQDLTSGNVNTAIGYEAIANQTSGDSSVALGYHALFTNLTGTNNTALGYESLLLATGHDNTSAGFQTLSSLTTGNNNSGLGNLALSNITTGSYNTAIGYQANTSSGNLSNATAIGARAYVAKSNSVVLGSIAGLNGATESVRVGIGTSSPDSSAILDLSTLQRGFLLPRMTNVQRNAIASPAAGLLVYSTTSNTIWMYNGTAWDDLDKAIGSMGANTGDGLVYTNSYTYVPGFPETIIDSDGDSKVTVNFPYDEERFRVILNDVPALNIRHKRDNPFYLTVIETQAANFISSLYFGHHSGDQQNNAVNNTAIGYAAMENAFFAHDNTAIGTLSLSGQHNGWNNTAIGVIAMGQATSADNNVAIGFNALGACAGGIENVAIGSNALDDLISRWSNVAIGANADVDGLVNMQWVDNGTAIGANAYVTKPNCMVLGSITGVNGGTSNTNVGLGTTAPDARLHIRTVSTQNAPEHLIIEDNVNEFGRIHFGTTQAPGVWEFNGKPAATEATARLNFAYGANVLSIHGDGDAVLQGNLTQNSDRRLKRDLHPLEDELSSIKKLNGYTFNWIDTSSSRELQYGVLAQEVQKIFPELVNAGDDGFLSVNYPGLIPVLLESVKELDAKLDGQEGQLMKNEELILLLEAELRSADQRSRP